MRYLPIYLCYYVMACAQKSARSKNKTTFTFSNILVKNSKRSKKPKKANWKGLEHTIASIGVPESSSLRSRQSATPSLILDASMHHPSLHRHWLGSAQFRQLSTNSGKVHMDVSLGQVTNWLPFQDLHWSGAWPWSWQPSVSSVRSSHSSSPLKKTDLVFR